MGTTKPVRSPEVPMFFRFPEDARWNEDRQAVEFGVGVGEYEGVVRVPRQVFRRFINGAITPERCVEAYHLQRTRFELVAERKLRHRQLADDGNVEITGRDLARRRAQQPAMNTNGCKLEIDDNRGGAPLSGANQAGDTGGRPR
jgi:hypothetical protein